MRIGHVTFHGCIRCHKIAWEQCRVGWQVHLITHMIAPSHSWNTYSSVHLYDPTPVGGGIDPRQLINEIRMLESNVDLFHVHNEPNWIFQAVKGATTKPVVFDIHDWTSIRKAASSPPTEIEYEKWAIDHADGFIVPSDGYLRRILAKTLKPCIKVYSKVGSWLYPEQPQKTRPGITFEGGVSSGKGDAYNYSYRDWAEFAKEAVTYMSPEEKFYFYTANSGDYSKYADDKIVISPPKIYPELLDSLGTHSVGLVGSPFPLDDFIDSVPNKLFEYLSAGLPVIVLNSPEAKKFVEANGLGVGITDAKSAVQALHELSDNKNILRKRWEYAMEAEIPKLTGFYQEVLCTSNRKVTTDPTGSSKSATGAALATGIGASSSSKTGYGYVSGASTKKFAVGAGVDDDCSGNNRRS